VGLEFGTTGLAIGTYMIGGGKSAIWSSHLPAGIFQAFESLLWVLSAGGRCSGVEASIPEM
jgi:hypothetical protein